jgi:hypothetical protein
MAQPGETISLNLGLLIGMKRKQSRRTVKGSDRAKQDPASAGTSLPESLTIATFTFSISCGMLRDDVLDAAPRLMQS